MPAAVGFILPWGEELGHDIPLWDFRVPGVTSISADTHKYAYGFKGMSVLAFAGHLGVTFSGGLLAATWASMVSLGRGGYLERARAIFDTSFAMVGSPTRPMPSSVR
jgi:glutamate/tyrosine decarboxylase-like PLP-dependent enzyme